jgi:hypothetical protein
MCDDLFHLEADHLRSGTHDPLGCFEDAKRAVPEPGRDARPAERAATARGHDRQLVALPLESPRARSDEMPGGVRLGRRPARRYESDAHGIL